MRKSPAKKRRLLPDPKFYETMVTQFVNNMMQDGKKSISFRIFYDALDVVSNRVEDTDAIDVWKKAIENVTPAVEVRSRRIGGATFQIPQPIRDSRKLSMAMKWMIGYARKRNDKSIEIISGLTEGDIIVAEGLKKVRPLEKIKPINK